MSSPIVVIIARRSYVPLVNDDDEVIPGNIGALKLGLMSVQFEDKNDRANSIAYMNDARMLLDVEREEVEQAEVPTLNIPSNFGAGDIYNVR